MIIENKATTAELRDWLRGESSLVSFSRSLRMEGPSPETSNDTIKDGAKQPTDPFEGLDLDSLDPAVADVINKAKGNFALLQKSETTLKEERDRLDKEARTHQSRADRFGERLRSHNLLDDQRAVQKPVDPAQELADAFVADGMEPKAALAYAKMFQKNNSILEQKIIDRVGEAVVPLAQSVGDIHADRALHSAMSQDTDGVFSLPGIQESVQSSVKALVSQGQVVTPDLVNNLRDMAFGAYVMKNGTDSVIALKQNRQQDQQYQGTRFNTRGGNRSGVVNNPEQRQREQAPPAANPETARAAAAIADALRRGLPTKGGKK